MTPDLSTPEGRADTKTLAEVRLRMVNDPEYRADFWCRVAASERAICRQVVDDIRAERDAAHATIERLTAPVTEAEIRSVFEGSIPGIDWDGIDAVEMLTRFIARRKDPTP